MEVALSKPISKQAVDQIMRLYESGNFSELNSKILKLSKRHPNNYFIHNMGGIAATQTNLFNRALQYYRRAIEIKPDASETYVNVGNLYRKNGKLDEAKTSLERAINLNRTNIGAHNCLGLTWLQLGQYAMAIRLLEAANKLAPNNPEILYNLGTAYQEAGQIDSAEKKFKAALKVDPSFFEAHNNLGLLLMDQGKYEDAVGAFKKSLAIKPNSYAAFCNLGNALKDSGNVGEAVLATTRHSR